MFLINMLNLGLMLLTFTVVLSTGQQTYKACVVQVSPRRNSSITPKEVKIDNLNLYLKIIDEFKNQSLDIIVFPENGLTKTDPTPEEVTHLSVHSITAGEDNYNACNNQTKDENMEVLQKLSCKAKTNKVYIVFNAIEKVNETDFYSTTFVLNKKGDLIKRYRKINRFNELNYKSGNSLATFQTDFGNFGLLTGSDIFYKTSGELLKNYNVTDVIYCTSLESTLPFFSSLSLQAGYALSGGVNLLASSISVPKQHIAGSGVYLSNGTIPEVYHLDSSDKGYHAIIQNIPCINSRVNQDIKKTNIKKRVSNKDAEKDFLKKTTEYQKDESSAISLTFNKTELNSTTVLNDITCEITAVFQEENNNNNRKYMQNIFSGPTNLSALDRQESLVAICGLTVCDGDDCENEWSIPKNSKFESITLRLTINKGINVVIPITLRTDLTPTDCYTFKSTLKDGNTIIEMKTTKNIEKEFIVTFGIYANLNNLVVPDTSESKLKDGTTIVEMKVTENIESKLKDGTTIVEMKTAENIEKKINATLGIYANLNNLAVAQQVVTLFMILIGVFIIRFI